MSPIVSIVLPTYNRVDYLREAVDSVRAQTVSDWELVVSDDGSTDQTVSWLDSLDDRRIVVLRHEHTGRRSLLRNAALAIARSDWIAFLDSDDRWLPEKLERQLAYHAENPSFRWSYTNRRLIDADGRPLSTDAFQPWTPRSGWILSHVLTHEANIALPSVMIHRMVLTDAGGFNPESRSAEDYELWLRLSERWECSVMEQQLVDVRKHKTTGFQRPEVDLAFAEMFSRFANRTFDANLRGVAERGAATHALAAAERLTMQRRFSEAKDAFQIAVRTRPFAPFVYRRGARLLRKALHALSLQPSEPSA